MLPRTIPFRARPPWFGGTLQTLRALRWPLPVPLPLGERLWLPLADGDALAAMLHLPRPDHRHRAGPRPLALLVHGLVGTEDDPCVREAAAGLLRRGFPVLRLNLRGNLLSAVRSTSHYHLGRTEDLAQALSALPPALTGQGVVVAGWSLGGALATLLLARGMGPGMDQGREQGGPRLLGGAAISAPLQPGLAYATIDANPLLGPAMLARYRLEILAVPGARDLTPRLREAALAARSLRALEETVTAPRMGYPSYEVYLELNRPAAVLPALRRPLLLMTAEDDPLVPPEVLEGIPWADCPAVTPLRVAGGGHCGFYDTGGFESLSVRAMGAFFLGLAEQAARGGGAATGPEAGDAASPAALARQAAMAA
jgi:predicted alpha/beta-fold hydrolase